MGKTRRRTPTNRERKQAEMESTWERKVAQYHWEQKDNIEDNGEVIAGVITGNEVTVPAQLATPPPLPPGVAVIQKEAQAIVDSRTKAARKPFSVQSPADDIPREVGGGGFVWWTGGNLDSYIPVAEYGTPSRTKDLRAFSLVAPLILLAQSVLTKKVQSLQWTIEGGRNLAQKWQKRLNNFENGDGWDYFIARWIRSYVESDKPACAELIRAAPSWAVDPDGQLTPRGQRAIDRGNDKVWEIVDSRVMDPANTFFTTSVEFPLIYRNPHTGARHQLRPYQFMTLIDLPSIDDNYPHMGLCLHGDSSVLMESGVHKRVSELVKEKSQENVVTVDAEGKLTTRKITGWYKNLRQDRRMVNIRGLQAQHCKGSKQRNSWVTEDHPVLTPGGWSRADELRTGDEIVTGMPAPNKRQASLLLGTLLGDASACRPHKNTRLGMAHNREKGEEWFNLKVSALRDFGWHSYYEKNEGDVVTFPNGHTFTCQQDHMVHGWSSFHPSLNWYRDEFYDDEGKKHIPLDAIKKYMSPLLLAAWYLDDGNIVTYKSTPWNTKPTAHITATGFAPEEVRAVCTLLTSFGYRAKPTKDGHGSGRLNIGFMTDGSQKLFNDIAPYIPPSMRYKIPKGLTPFRADYWDLGKADCFVDRAVVSRNYKEVKGYNEPKHVYCIDVAETHNFISAGVVVHNCAVSRAVWAAQEDRMIIRYAMEKMSENPGAGIALANVNTTLLETALNSAKAQREARGVVYYKGVIFLPVLDPSGSTRLEFLSFADLPDGFSRSEMYNILKEITATAFGLDILELGSIPGRLGTATQAKVAAAKGRTKTMGAIMQGVERAFEYKLLPESVSFQIKKHDQDEELQRAQIDQIYFENAIRYSQFADPRIAKQYLVDKGAVPNEFPYINVDLTAGEEVVTDTGTDAPGEEQEETGDNMSGAPVNTAPAVEEGPAGNADTRLLKSRNYNPRVRIKRNGEMTYLDLPYLSRQDRFVLPPDLRTRFLNRMKP